MCESAESGSVFGSINLPAGCRCHSENLLLKFLYMYFFFFFFQAEDGIRDRNVTGVQTCALPISSNLNACPTTPWPKVAPFCRLPLLLPATSAAFPSAGHQLTNPLGAGTQFVLGDRKSVV